MDVRRILIFLSSLGLADSTLALGLLLGLSHHHLNAGELRIDHDTSTILAHDNLLVHLDVELTLWRNLVEATTASIALHINNSETIACVLTNALEACEQTRLCLLYTSPSPRDS